MSKLQLYIPDKLKIKIKNIAIEDNKTIVYRVDKTGDRKIDFVKSTYEEMQDSEFSRSYPLDDLGTYSTSVYDSPEPCINFINSMGKRAREKFPKPVVRQGCLRRGLSIHTFKYKKEYMDVKHIDYWIYEGYKEKVLKDFSVYEE